MDRSGSGQRTLHRGWRQTGAAVTRHPAAGYWAGDVAQERVDTAADGQLTWQVQGLCFVGGAASGARRLPSPAYSALAGKNGRIAFTVNGGSEGSDAPADFWVKTVRPDEQSLASSISARMGRSHTRRTARDSHTAIRSRTACASSTSTSPSRGSSSGSPSAPALTTTRLTGRRVDIASSLHAPT